MKSQLIITINENHSRITFSGNLNKIARELARVGVECEEFALALNLATIGMNEELEAIRLRNEMIGMIENS